MELHLTGRTVLITGASKGIGLGVARCFAQEGCHLRLAARAGDLLARGWAEEVLGDADRYEELLKTYPFGRAGEVDEVAPTVVFLASDRSSYTSGTIVTIDGGRANRPAG